MHASVQPHLKCPSILVEWFLDDVKELSTSSWNDTNSPKSETSKPAWYVKWVFNRSYFWTLKVALTQNHQRSCLPILCFKRVYSRNYGLDCHLLSQHQKWLHNIWQPKIISTLHFPTPGDLADLSKHWLCEEWLYLLEPSM